jgi:hypothetical protein
MLREIQHRFQDRAMLQVRREFPELDAVLRADKGNKLDTKVGKSPRNAMAEVLKLALSKGMSWGDSIETIPPHFSRQVEFSRLFCFR